MTSSTKERVSFGKIKMPIKYPDLLSIQLDSFKDFFQIDTTPENQI